MATSNAQPLDGGLPAMLLVLTAVTGVVDAVSYLALGHVFTANMTGNVAFLGFGIAGIPTVSVSRSAAALAAFFAGAFGSILVMLAGAAAGAWLLSYSLSLPLLAAAIAAAGCAVAIRFG